MNTVPPRPLHPLLVALAAWAAFAWTPDRASADNPATAPAWTLKDTTGKTVRLADFHGKVVLLNFWATWCPPCRQEIPGFVALQAKYGQQGFVVVGVAMDEAPQAVAPFVDKAGINYPVVYGSALVAASDGGLPVVPTSFLIGRDGKILAMAESAIDAKKLESVLKPLL